MRRKTLTLPRAKKLVYGDIILHKVLTNKDGTPQRFKIIGKPKTWKTRPTEVLISVKRGMYEFYKFKEYELFQFYME